MIKIVHAKRTSGYLIELEFSDGSSGEYDCTLMLARDTELTRPLSADQEFARFFLEFGALCWPNGLELSPEALHRRLKDAGTLRSTTRVA